LAIATLVGEGERRQAEQAIPDAEAVTPPPPPEAAPAPAEPSLPAAPTPAEPPVLVPTRPKVNAPLVEPDAPSGEPSPWPSVFLGVGLFAGPGLDDDAWRLGGSGKASWDVAHGVLLLTSVDYSWRASTTDYTASWLSLQAGLGYRLRLSERASAGISLRGGAQQLRFAARARGETASSVTWNPVVALGLDFWRLLGPNIGIWAAANAQTMGREIHLFVAPERDVVTSHAVDVSGVLGVGWWIP
jgi:hypothetical protein